MGKYDNFVLNTQNKLVYQKHKQGYKIYCTQCNRYETIDKETLKQIQASHICPMCFNGVKPSRKTEFSCYKYVHDESMGYLVDVYFKFGKPIKSNSTLVARWLGGQQIEVRYIRCNMCYTLTLDWNKKDWKLFKRSGDNYFYRFWDYQRGGAIPKTKKEYIEKALHNSGMFNEDMNKIKSNQKKLLMDNLMTPRQMKYVIAFDLKSYDEVYKYRKYMVEPSYYSYKTLNNDPDIRKPLNVYYLDYLVRNNINLHDFYDYMKQCNILGFKLDKPKDFEHRHQVLSDLAKIEETKSLKKKITKRFKELSQYTYKNGNIAIIPFKSNEEIVKCGKELHNCIASCYLKEYANKETDLYHLDVKGKTIVAIEILDGCLEQARIDHNEDCPKKYLKHIKTWCNSNKWGYAYE